MLDDQDLSADVDLEAKPTRGKGKRGKAGKGRCSRRAKGGDVDTDDAFSQLPAVVLIKPCSNAGAKQAKRLDQLKSKSKPKATTTAESAGPPLPPTRSTSTD